MCFETIFDIVISPGSYSIGASVVLEIDFKVFGRNVEFLGGLGFEPELPGRELETNGV